MTNSVEPYDGQGPGWLDPGKNLKKRTPKSSL